MCVYDGEKCCCSAVCVIAETILVLLFVNRFCTCGVPLLFQGGESEVVAKFYSIAFKQVFDDETGYSDWKVVDYELSGGEAYY